MKVEVRCSSCNSGWHVTEESLRAGFVCPACSAPIREENIAASAPAPKPRREVVCPRCNLHFSPRESPTEKPRERARPTILVVEDMEYFREVARDVLSARYDVMVAGSVSEACRILDGGGIDLVVLDLKLGSGEDGERLLSARPKSCPILIYTAEDETEMYGDSWDQLRGLGADDIVLKGMNVGESLARKVAGLLGVELEEEDAIG